MLEFSVVTPFLAMIVFIVHVKRYGFNNKNKISLGFLLASIAVTAWTWWYLFACSGFLCGVFEGLAATVVAMVLSLLSITYSLYSRYN